MGKADYNHDYYRDLDLDPTADEADIKKQYKKLALLYHPDRNLGNEEAASKKFQLINTASEILLDPKERTKYDMYRNPRPSYGAGYSGASGVRGNPYADMASKTNAKYGPPPSRTGAPPRSKGASNYDKFARATPTQSAFQAAQEGPEARKNTWNAWERMHHPTARNDQGPFRSRMSEEFPSSTSQSTRPESGARRRPVPPPRSGAFDEYRDTNSSPRKNPNMNNNKPFSQSTNMPPPVPNRKGFMPNTPGAGDEPPAPRGAYFTQRDKPTAPPPPPRESTSTRYADADPLKQFKAKSHPVPDPEFTMEGRISTPYANHGGERIDPFESTNLNRSNSSKETKEASKGQVPRTGSDSNLNKPSRSRSYAEPKATRRTSTKPLHTSISSDSDDDFVTMNSSKSSSKRTTGSSTARKVPETFNSHVNTDGPPLRSDQANSNSTQSNIFSFNLSNNVFNNAPPRPAGFSSSQENISTKFNSEDWAGEFQAGSGFANPNPNNAAMGASTGPGRQRSKSTTRMRTKSPPKSSQGFMPQTAEPQQMESPGTKQFVPQQWDQQFSPDVFMPNGQTTPRPTRRKPSLRPTMGGKAAFVDDNSTSDEQPPHFSARKEDPRVSPPPILTPEPMDIDTPPNTHTVPDIAPPPAPPNFNAKNLHIDAEKLKHPFNSSESHPQPNSGAADSLKVDFESLKVTELVSTLEIPKAPIAPEFPADISTSDRPTLGAYSAYQQLFAKYMAAWDLYDKSFLKHLVGRHNENDKLKEARWKDEEGTKTYRRGLEVDQEVLRMWMESKEKHARALKGWQIMKEKMR